MLAHIPVVHFSGPPPPTRNLLFPKHIPSLPTLAPLCTFGGNRARTRCRQTTERDAIVARLPLRDFPKVGTTGSEIGRFAPFETCLPTEIRIGFQRPHQQYVQELPSAERLSGVTFVRSVMACYLLGPLGNVYFYPVSVCIH
jgi:hypothetical protein